VVGLEHPELWGGLVDVDVTDAARAGADVLAEIAGARVEDQIAIRAGRRFVARLASSGHVRVSRVPLRRDGAYLVTGGLGRLGLEVARWMAAQVAGHLTLVSRTGLPDRARWNDEHPAPTAAKIAAVRAIESLGCAVTVVAADVADARQMAGVMNEFGGSAPPLRGVVHAASATGHARVADLSAANFGAMMAPKVTGAIVLQSLCAAHALDFLVLFSSTTGLLGSVSMGHYAAANAALDALASAGRSRSLPVTSIAWGAWEHLEFGSDEVRRATEGGGLRRLTVEQGLDALGWLLRPHSATPIVVDAHWPTLKAVYEARRRRPLLDEVGRAAPVLHPQAAPRKPRSEDLLRRLQQGRASDRQEILSRWVLEEAASVLGIAPDDLDPGQGLFDLGMDSLMSVELKGRLETGLDCRLPTTLTFNYPSVAAIVGYLEEQVLDGSRAPAPAQAAAAAPPESRPAPAPAALDDLSEDELATLLAGRLADL
jgi:myxalamid-type polyketide synthase MxaE and MxaD